MVPRAVLLVILPVVSVAAGAASLPGCAPAPVKKPDLAALVPSATPAASRAVALSRVQLERPSELAPVTEDKPDPEAQKQFQARIAQPAIPLVPTTSPPRVTAIALDDTRRGEARDMAPATEIHAATLAEGQRATMPVKIAAGACETFIAQGGLGVIEVDLFLTGGTGQAEHILAEDPATGPIAVIGGHGKCIPGAVGTGTEAVLHAAVRRGAGVVLVRAYRK